MRQIIIMVNIGDEGIIEYETYNGYLLEDGRAVYVTSAFFQVWLANVNSTDNPDVYIQDGPYLQLGIIREGGDEVYVIKRVIEMLKRLTAYEFLTEYFDWKYNDVEFDLV